MTPSTNLTCVNPDNSPLGEHSQSCFTSLNRRACRMSSCISSFCIVCKNSRKVAILHSKAGIPYRRTYRRIGSIERSIYSSFFSALDFGTKLSFCIFARITALTVPSTLTHTDPSPTTHTKSAKKQPFRVAIFRQLCYNGHASL